MDIKMGVMIWSAGIFLMILAYIFTMIVDIYLDDIIDFLGLNKWADKVENKLVRRYRNAHKRTQAQQS